MKLIIDIPEEIYESQRYAQYFGTWSVVLQKHFENGIPLEQEPNRCNQCKYYEGVHNVQGHAPCSFLKCGGVLWNWHCSNYEPTGAERSDKE